MPVKIDIDPQPMRPGETRLFRVYGSGSMAVEVKCFVTNPPPPGFRPCPACGSTKMNSGDSGRISAPIDFTGGSIQISVEDSEGDRAHAKIRVGRMEHDKKTTEFEQ